ncbi:hypothetical protein [Micrococcus luteus]|uniref:hypothetical protein n=1 Tax=Micrococcus luteus TaxID=1270 RepID=UPI000BF192BF|nr:hypothetical protein [Micrococcus luteus]PEH50707.1 hypothetical protein CRM77_05150 [Micrococcus luteus]
MNLIPEAFAGIVTVCTVAFHLSAVTLVVTCRRLAAIAGDAATVATAGALHATPFATLRRERCGWGWSVSWELGMEHFLGVE